MVAVYIAPRRRAERTSCRINLILHVQIHCILNRADGVEGGHFDARHLEQPSHRQYKTARRISFATTRRSGLRQPPHLERLVGRRRHDAPPVRGDGDAIDLRRRHIITKAQWTPQRTWPECPFSVATQLPVSMSHTLSVSSHDPDTTRRPSGNTATPQTYDEARSSQKYSGRRNARNASALPASPGIRPSPRPTP